MSPSAGGAEQRVGDRVQQRVGIRVAEQAVAVRDRHAAEDQRPARRPARACPSLRRCAGRARSCGASVRALRSSALGQREVLRPGELEVLRARPARAAAHGPSASIALASSVTRAAGLRQRLAQQAEAEHLRRLRRPLVAARSSVRCDAAAVRLLERVGQRQRQQAADGVVARRRRSAGRPTPARTRQRAASCTSTQSSARAPRRCSSARPLATRGARASRRRSARPRRARRRSRAPAASNCVVARRQHDQRGLQPRHRGQRRQRVRDHRRARRCGAYCLGTGAPARAARRRRRARARSSARSGSGHRLHERQGAASIERQPCLQSRRTALAPAAAGRFALSGPPCSCPPSPPASASRCPARSARPTRCCWRACAAARRDARPTLPRIVTAEPADTQRLADELPFFAPDLRIALFPDWETLPYDTFSPHQDLISERLATLWRMRPRRRRRGAAAGDDRADAPGAAGLLAGYTFHFKQKAAARRSRAEGAAHARRLQPREPGRVARASTRCAAA